MRIYISRESHLVAPPSSPAPFRLVIFFFYLLLDRPPATPRVWRLLSVQDRPGVDLRAFRTTPPHSMS